MKKRYFSVGTAALLSLGLFTSTYAAVDACTATEMGHPGNGSGVNGDQTGSINGTPWGFEQWYQGGNGSMTYYSNGTFKANWNNSNDYLARVGFRYPNNPVDHKTKTYAVDYKYTKTGSASYSYIGVYGWTTDPEVEYYIVDDWLSPERPGYGNVGPEFGTINVDGAIYTIHAFFRKCEPAKSDGNCANFVQFFSVRQTPRQCGHIDISAHFNKWEELLNGRTETLPDSKQGQTTTTMQFGKLLEVMLMAEAGGGTTGSIDYTYFDMTDNGTPTEPPTPIERKPFGGTATLLPGTVEAENFDEGDYGVSYSGTKGASGEDGDHEYRGSDYSSVDIVSGGSGRAIGYTAKGEWLEYTINVDADGEYDIEANVSNGSGSGTVQLSLDGTDLVSLPFNGTTDKWDVYELATGKATLTKGQHTLRITIANDNTNVDYVKFTLPGYTPSSSASTITSSSSGEPAAIAQDIRMDGVSKSLQVFDLQGKFLGFVSVAKGGNVAQAVKARVQKAGVYLVKQGGSVQRIAIK